MKRFDFDRRPGTPGAVPGAGQAVGRRHGPAGLWVLVLLAWLASAVAQAQVPYAADPDFNNGQYFLDEFWSNPTAANNYFEGKKVARLDNGDIVVAALVKNPDANQTNGYWNIGLVRYNATGTQRVLWPNGGSYAHVNGNYIVYPKTNTARYTRIQDVVAWGDKILVAVGFRDPASNNDTVQILVFGTDGSFKSLTTPFGDFPSFPNEYPGGMAVYRTIPGGVSVVVVAHRAVSGVGWRPLFTRYELNANGTLTSQTGIVHLNTHWCSDTTRQCAPVGIALAPRSLTASFAPAIYVVNQALNAGVWGYTVTRVDENGVEDDDWAINFRSHISDGATPAHSPAYAIEVRTTGLGIPSSPYRHEIFVAAEVKRGCGNGVVVAKYDHENSTLFQINTVFGGKAENDAACGTGVNVEHWPVDMALNGNRLAVVGYGRYTLPDQGGGPDHVDYHGFTAVLDASAVGSVPLLDFRNYSYPISGAGTFRHTALWGVTPTTDNKFVVTGDARYPPNDTSVPINLRGKNAVATLGIAPEGDDDTIFRDGFDGDGSNPPQPAQFRGTNIGNMTMTPSECDNGGNGPVPGVVYHTFDSRLVDYYAGKGMKALRVLLAWECMQKQLNGSIPAAANGNYKTYFDTVKALADYASNVKGMHVVLTPWAATAGGEVCGACYKDQVIGSGAVTSAHFADFWTKMANHFKSNPKVAFSLINEPNHMSTMDWFSIAQTAVTAIRATGATNRIYVPGNGYTAAASWEMNFYDTAATQRSNAYGWLNARGVGLPLQDPQNNMVVEVHSYADQAKGGLDNGITSATVLADDVSVPVDWARAHGLKIYVAEVALFHGNPLAVQTWNNFVTYAGANTDTLIGFTWWAGGYPGWWDNMEAGDFSITPTNAGTYTGDNANMNMIKSAFQ